MLVLKKEADVQSGKARGKNTRVRAVSSHRKRMREPPLIPTSLAILRFIRPSPPIRETMI